MHPVAAKVAKIFSVTNERGVTAIEYGLLAALIALGIIGAVTILGGNLSAVFQAVADKVVAP